MAETKHRDYLAAKILVENQPVTYKLLSRALQINVSVAKWMLFDFHQNQNAKRANSIHATYLISGTKRPIDDTNGTNDRKSEDVSMRSSPFMSSMPEQEEREEKEVPIKKSTILLVREEEFAKTRAEFSEEASIHIYSLGPGPLENLNILASCNREVIAKHADKDPLERWRAYGSIHNPHIKRRTAKYAPPPAAATSAKAAAKPTAKPPVAAQLRKEVSTSSRRGSASEDNTSARSTPQPVAAPSTLKRSDSTKSTGTRNKTAGDIFKSFAKAKAKPKEAAKPNESTHAPVEDDLMQGMSEDEGEEEEPEIQIDIAKIEAAKKARDERAEKLKKMMDDDDEDMPDAGSIEEKPSAAPPPEKAETPKDDEEPIVMVENGRRRGKRRVTKKKTVKDEEGYLVTKEEAVWESFSEDEPAPKRAKPAPKPVAAAKGKPAGKKGQGSIASFFKKA
ncbi:DNA polymerase subunit Cdc27 [Boeremia exigua]|uniref:DNA polymerase subunit Cdc27 n=1 Tax=Boeremia exigua TaxID=749465 RepID=UPI001E8E92E9|nr:DNA polymerase subunit Cdc27 [Boeremia exigua]KAH6614107.1 DNA polymerase subunit Cdc27 [Boeremia exigua]